VSAVAFRRRESVKKKKIHGLSSLPLDSQFLLVAFSSTSIRAPHIF